MNNSLDQLIPASVQNLLDLRRIDVAVVLQGIDCKQSWPKVKVSVDNNLVHAAEIKGVKKIKYCAQALDHQKICTIKIEYHSKTDADTDVDSDGKILSNQSVILQELWINDVDIVKSRAIHQNIGNYTMSLPPHKHRYFLDHGFSIDPTTNTHMFENGSWIIELEMPLLSTLTAKHNFLEPWEKVDTETIVNQLFDQLTICQELENQLSAENSK